MENRKKCGCAYLRSLKIRNKRILKANKMELETSTNNLLTNVISKDKPIDLDVDDLHDDYQTQTVTTYVICAIGVLAVCGNGFVMIIIMRSKKLKHRHTNFFMMNQSFVDFLAGIFMIAGSLPVTFKSDNLFSWAFCKFITSQYAVQSWTISSTYSLVLLTTERYIMICHAVKYKVLFTKTKARCCIIFVWVFGHCFLLPSIASTNYENGECVDNFEPPSSTTETFLNDLSVLLIIFIFPISIMVFAYLSIFKVTRRRMVIFSVNATSAYTELPLSEEQLNILKTMATVCISFVICWLPEVIALIIVRGDNSTHDNFVTLCFAYFNCAINPLIYTMKYKSFKEECKKQLGTLYRRNLVSAFHTNTQELY